MPSGGSETAPTRWTRHAVPLAFVFAILLALPSFNAPLFQDDAIHRAMLLDKLPGVHWSPLELYDFIGSPTRPATLLRESGSVPWFAAGDLKLRFFRPLSSATIALDAKLFGEHTWLARLHSLGWFFGVLALVAILHRRFLPAPSAAVATLMYALSGGHLMPVSWIAARHALISTAFSLLSFWLHVRMRDDGWKPGRWLAPPAFATGLLGGEMALGALAVIGAWELAGRRDPIRHRFLAILPFAAVALVYFGFYAAMDYGAKSTGAYVDPSGGLSSAATVLRHFWILVGELVAAVPSDAAGAGTVRAETIAALCGAAVAIVAWVVFRLSRSHVGPREVLAVRWMAAAAAAATLPGTFAIVGGRVLTLALFPATGVIAVMLTRGIAVVRDRDLRTLRRMFVAVAIVGFALGHFICGPALRVVLGVWIAQIARVQHEQAAWVPRCPGVMVLVAVSDPTIATYVPATAILRDRRPERLRVLSMAPYDHRIDNVTRTGFDLTTGGRDRERSIWERLYRSAPMPPLTRVTIPSLDATVVEDRGGAPVRVRFDFGEPLDSPHLCFLQWRDGRIAPLTPPKPGETIELPHEPGPMRW